MTYIHYLYCSTIISGYLIFWIENQNSTLHYTKSMSVSEFSVDFNSPYRSIVVPEILKEYGVVVINNVFSGEECDYHVDNIVGGIQTISPEIMIDTPDNLGRTWCSHNLMPQTREGLHQIGYSPLAWPVRSSPKVNQLFLECYSNLRGYDVKRTVLSLDAINVRPPIAPFHTIHSRDWPHFDQTIPTNPYECIQGQVVLTTTDASFVCTPKSHRIHKEVCNDYGALGKPGNFFMLSKGSEKDVKKRVSRVGGEWQIPIIVPRGSVILWLSSVIHSAKLAEKPKDNQVITEKWQNWRCVIYVSQRPYEELNNSHFKRLRKVWDENLTTNHWGNKIFSATSGKKIGQVSPAISKLSTKPVLIKAKHPELFPDNSEYNMYMIGQ